jgi:hypothetical protein
MKDGELVGGNLNKNFLIDFHTCSPVPLLLQDVFGGIINNHIIISGGCAAHVGRGKQRHFSDSTWAINRTDLISEWERKNGGGGSDGGSHGGSAGNINVKYIALPNFPGSARQKGSSLTIDDQILLCWGGFSYYPCKKFTPNIMNLPKKYPVGYRDGYALFYESGAGVWIWKKLPNLPEFVNAGASLTRIGEWIYLFGGCEYYASAFNTFNDHDGNNINLGARLYRINAINLKKYILNKSQDYNSHGTDSLVWERLVDCPGTPRMNHVGIEVGGKLYIQGGISGRQFKGEFYSTVDNWYYDPTLGTWHEVSKCPSSNTNWQSGIKMNDRYIVLVGGAHTVNAGSVNKPRDVVDKNKCVTSGYGKLIYHLNSGIQGLMSADILVYDTINDSYSHMTNIHGGIPLPRELNNPLVLEIKDDLIAVICGEIEMTPKERNMVPGGGIKTHLSDIFLLGHIVPKSV